MIKIIGLENYIIPMYGNKRNLPYGDLIITDGMTSVKVKIKEDLKGQYITFNHKRYYVSNVGRLYSPKFVFEGACYENYNWLQLYTEISTI